MIKEPQAHKKHGNLSRATKSIFSSQGEIFPEMGATFQQLSKWSTCQSAATHKS